MHLRSITMKGFKSFPDRTRLEFAEGVSVIVGPNGSGKSNVTDAVLWALGEQSPLAVRGQTMQDVIFSGGPGVPSRSSAEVEVVIDDSDFELGTGFSELAIMRRLDRSGDGEYRLNGARCRLVDVLEALSDTGLGKEMHSVVSQGRVEAVIHSSPRDRRLLVEEAAGLGKHRKRRRRAELKLGRTEENLARALDLEREARSRLRPLKRQAEAADLHARLERQALEARRELAADAARTAGERLAAAESEVAAARDRRRDAERRLQAVFQRREAAEQALAAHGRAREALSGRLFAATTAIDRVEMRLERAREIGAAAEEEGRRLATRLLRADGEEAAAEVAPARPGTGDAVAAGGDGSLSSPPAERIARLEAELEALDRAGRPDKDLARLRSEREACERRSASLEDEVTARRLALSAADADVGSALARRRDAEAALAAVQTAHGRAHAELEALSELGRRAALAPGAGEALAQRLRVERGYELAVAATLGPLVRAGIAGSIDEATSLLDGAAAEEATILVERPAIATGERDVAVSDPPPTPSAERLLDHVRCGPGARGLLERLLADAWLVESLGGVRPGFRGIAVTRAGRALAPATGELRQAATGGDERLIERLARRDELTREGERCDRALEQAEQRSLSAARAVAVAEEARDRCAEALRQGISELTAADEETRAAVRAVARHEQAVDQTPAVRRAEITAELRAERRIADRAERRRAERRRRLERLRARSESHEELRRSVAEAAPALEAAAAAIAAHRRSLHAELEADEAAGARIGEELRGCAHEEARLQEDLRGAGEVVTGAEVSAQRARDVAADAERELGEVERRLGGGPSSPRNPRPLPDERRVELRDGLERLERRRERLGPVNPLAQAEYEEARARLEELERQRSDLERALAELRGVIAETDRRIRDSFERTFEATARNFEEVVEELFPGGRGRLRLVMPDAPRPVLGGEAAEGPPGGEAGPIPEADAAESDEVEPREPGIEVEVTPAGKSTRRLGLMSGGERALVALAFLFAVFLARPCPFYVLDEVEAALDDLNIDRFLRLVRRCAQRAQFIVVTHQKRTMDAADRLYGVSMGGDGVSKVISRRLARERADVDTVAAERSEAAA